MIQCLASIPAQPDVGGPAFAKLQKKTHLLTQSLALTSVVVGADTNAPVPAAPAQPPQISWAWPDTGGTETKESKKREPDRDILLAIESAKLVA